VVRAGVATFVDIARPRGALSDQGAGTQADFGVGLRLRVASQPECLRLDFARAASDGRTAISLGFESPWSRRN
jgi:hypothetical protein